MPAMVGACPRAVILAVTRPRSVICTSLQAFLKMKFGKRLASEASRRWRPFYLDYKTVKRAIQHDVRARGESCSLTDLHQPVNMQAWNNSLQHRFAADPAGHQFAAAVQQELQRINAFYKQREQQLEVCIPRHCHCSRQQTFVGMLSLCLKAMHLQWCKNAKVRTSSMCKSWWSLLSESDCVRLCETEMNA